MMELRNRVFIGAFVVDFDFKWPDDNVRQLHLERSMNNASPKGQSNFQTKSTNRKWRLPALAGIGSLAVASWLLWLRQDDLTVAVAPPASVESRVRQDGRTHEAATGRRPLVMVLEDEASDATKPSNAPPEATVAELESRFRAEREPGARVEIITEIVGHNDASAVGAIARLFKSERTPSVKEALIAGLADIDPEAAPAERFTILAGAIRGQPRNVRTTAIDLLSQSDEPRDIALLAKAAVEDPDGEVRELAREILDAANAARRAQDPEGGR
jgi:HEAT repeats